MRLFVCSLLQAANQDFYDQRVADLVGGTGDRLRPIPQGSAHITYAFLGETDPILLDAIRVAVGHVGPHYAPIPIRLGPPAILFARSEPRLVCAHVIHGAPPLRQLTADIAMGLESIRPGTSLAPARSPHVTLARFRRGAGPEDARVVIAALTAAGSAGATRDDTVASIQIMSSTLGRDGPSYTVIADVPLAGR
jgi:2'-5' RNA ligase